MPEEIEWVFCRNCGGRGDIATDGGLKHKACSVCNGNGRVRYVKPKETK
jgi:DnaJ-class molecular chaperone